jgi:hypothetical protein
MIDTKAENLMREIETAISEKNQRLEFLKDSHARYQGPDRARASTEDQSPENLDFQFLARRVPQMAFDVPTVRCDSPLVEIADDVASFDRAMNRWTHSSNLRQICVQSAVNFNFAWECLLVSRRPAVELGEVAMQGGQGVPQWPYLTSIGELGFRDPLAKNPYDMRFAGHPIVADKENLLARCDDAPEEGWIRSAIEAMTEDAGLEKVGRHATRNGPTRNEVTYYQVWVADAEIDWETECLVEGKPYPEEKRYRYNGKLYYIATVLSSDGKKSKTAGMIREPVPYFGPPTGPYVFFGEHIVPNDPYFMGTLTANGSSIRFLNQATKVLNRGIRTYKQIAIINDVAEGLEEIIKNAGDQTAHTVAGFESNHVAMLQLGGVTTQMVAGVEIIQNRTDRGLGMDDGQYGRADDDASATAVAVAADSAGALSDWAKSQFIDGIQRALEIVGFFLWYDEEFVMPISIQDAIAMGDPITKYVKRDKSGAMVYGPDGLPVIEQPILAGGTDKERSYASLELTIEPFSMERMSMAVAARNAMTLTNTAATLAPLFQQNPAINGRVLMKALAKYTRIPEMEYIFDWNVMAEMLGSQKLLEYAQELAAAKPELSAAKKTASSPGANKATTPGASPPRSQPAAAPKPVKPGGMMGRATGGAAGRAAGMQMAGAA